MKTLILFASVALTQNGLGAAHRFAQPEISKMPQKESYREKRWEMVATHIEAAGIHDQPLLEALRTVPRHLFVPVALMDQAYEDHPLAIGLEQTISQPFIVAYMIQAASLTPESCVLEIGTGSGYNAAVLSLLCRAVYTIDIHASLSARALETLQKLNYLNVQGKVGDGAQGWPDAGPFDVILSTAASDHVPASWASQLKMGGRIILPLTIKGEQHLVRCTKTDKGLIKEVLLAVRFVPLFQQPYLPNCMD